MPGYEIRPLKSNAEYDQCEEIQTHVWGRPVVTREPLAVTQRHGGAVIGTIMKGRVVGFIYAFLAKHHRRLVHWSHLMGVEPEYRDRGFGFEMKLVHRRVALESGIKSICWTFDPLQSRNARLNISRLGATPEEYVPDYYGKFPSLLEKGLPSDRWVMNWQIASARVEKRLRGESVAFNPKLTRVNQTRLDAQGFPRNHKIQLNLADRRLLVEIPGQTDAMRSEAMSLAKRWRMEARKIFQSYLSQGYAVENFYPPGSATEGRPFYQLRRP